MTDGGVEAITGFVYQSMAALLDSLASDDWVHLAIDPAQTEVDCQKVDIEWTLRDGRTRVAQVKHSINSIEAPEARRWAADLQESRKADEYKLLLYAPTTAGASKIGRHGDVEVEAKQGDLLLLWDALAFRTLKYLRGRKQADVIYAQEAIKLMVGSTITGVTERKIWTRKGIEDLLIQLIESFERRRAIDGPSLTVSLLRIIRSASHGRCEEYVRYTFRNRTREPLPIPRWSIFWTDPSSIEVLRVWEPTLGRPFYQEWVHDATGTFELEITPSAIVPPNGAGVIEVHLHQANLIQQFGSPPVAWSFKDPLLSTDSPHEADVYVIFPSEGEITASSPCTSCSRTAHWELVTGPEQRQLAAVMQAVSPPRRANQELLARLERHFEFTD